MALDLTDQETKPLERGLRQALAQVKEGRPGARERVRDMFRQALADDRDLLRAAQAFADDAEKS